MGYATLPAVVADARGNAGRQVRGERASQRHGQTDRRPSEQVDPAVFALWTRAAQKRTPNTVWRPRGAEPPRAPSGPRGRAWRSTLRTSLDGVSARPSTCPAASGRSAKLLEEDDFLRFSATPGRDRRLLMDGEWLSRCDGELRGRVTQGCLCWEEDGTATQLLVHGERGDVVTMVVDGVGHNGVLSEDGRLLRWDDGDLWMRRLPEGCVDRSLRDCTAAMGALSRQLGQGGDEGEAWPHWRSSGRPDSSARHTCKSAAAAAFAAQSYASWNFGE